MSVIGSDGQAVPSVLYGAQTTLGVANFPALGRTLGDVEPMVRNFALVKLAAARVNHAMNVIDTARFDAIAAACEEVVHGAHADQFPTALVHGGGGTTANMNLNEVIAARAATIGTLDVHPIDHVNASQSTNDTYPTALALTVLELAVAPVEALHALAETFDAKAEEFADVEHLGRTCLQDAVTLSAGDTHRAQAAAVRRATTGLQHAVTALHAVPIGATAVGTGIGAPAGFGEACARELAAITNRPIVNSANRFDALGFFDVYSEIAAAVARSAITLAKIANDLRLLSSGPHGGFADLTIPKVQAGSSIMPAKVNPVIPEYVMQLSYRIRGNASCVDCAVAAGELEVNVMEPVIADALTRSLDDLTAAAATLNRSCIAGLDWNGIRRLDNVRAALDQRVERVRAEGYDGAAARATPNPHR